MKTLHVSLNLSYTLNFYFVIALFTLLMVGCQPKNENANQMEGQLKVTSSEMRPDNYFSQSLEAFARKDYKTSAKAIENAIESMKTIASVSPEKQQEEINNSIEELYDLASSVAIDKVEGINELNYFFARAGKALAGLHMHTTEEYYFNLDGKKAGAELIKAIDIVERNIQYHGRELNESEKQLITDLRIFSIRLGEGKATKAELEENIKKLTDRLNVWDENLSLKYSSIENKRKTKIHKD